MPLISKNGIDERVVPGITEVTNVQKHIARYNLALSSIDGSIVHLDVGCGSGYGTWLTSRLAHKVLGVDIDQETIDYAKKNYPSENIVYRKDNVEEMDFGVGVYDSITCFEVLEHLNYPHDVADKLWKSLRSGGKLFYSVPVNEEEGYNPHHKHIFNPTQAMSLFADKDAKYNFYRQVGINFYKGLDDRVSERFYLVGEVVKK